jgi:glycosyltransferase involved in cell wall biosynthesis
MENLNILFVGMYPDEVSPYRNVFFQNLIFAMADAGVKCTVVSPVPITRYRHLISKVSHKRTDHTPKGNAVTVYHPRYVSLSSKRIGSINTGIYSEKFFESGVLKITRKLTERFDAVYGHFFLSGGLAAIKVGREKSIPSFIAYGECSYETEIVRLYRELKKEDIEGLSGIIAVSTHNANILKSKAIFKGIPMIVAPNSVDMSLFFKRDKNDCREELGLPKDKFIVGFVGGFIDRKGDKRLLEAINSIDGVYGAFAGRGDNPPEGDKVLFCKALNHDKVPVLLNAVDVFCLPTQNEGSCNALVEAAACGVPVISSNLPFNDDLLTDKNSIRINPDSVDEIRNAINQLYDNKERRGELGQRIFESSREFDITVRENKIESFIKGCIGG